MPMSVMHVQRVELVRMDEQAASFSGCADRVDRRTEDLRGLDTFDFSVHDPGAGLVVELEEQRHGSDRSPECPLCPRSAPFDLDRCRSIDEPPRKGFEVSDVRGVESRRSPCWACALT